MKINKKNYLIIFILIILSILTIIAIPNYSMAFDPIANPDDFKPGAIQDEDAKAITDKANIVIGAITTIGVVISAITLGVLGIKYMIGSASEKAEYKKSMIPYLIGAVLLFAASSIVGIIGQLAQDLNI